MINDSSYKQDLHSKYTHQLKQQSTLDQNEGLHEGRGQRQAGGGARAGVHGGGPSCITIIRFSVMSIKVLCGVHGGGPSYGELVSLARD